MIFELLEVISTMALLLIAVSAIQLVILKNKELRANMLERTQEEIYRNESMRKLLNMVASRSQGIEWDTEMLSKDREFMSSTLEALNYCEYLCMGINQGVFSEKIIKSVYGTHIIIILTHFQRVIKESRYRSNAPDSFRYLTMIGEEWRKR